MTIKPETVEHYRDIARREYQDALGKCVAVGYICGIGKDEYTGDWKCDPPLVVRVVQDNDDSITHQNDEWIDPYWNVELVAGKLPEQLRSLWIDGPSHNMITGERDWKHARVLSTFESIKARVFGVVPPVI